MRVRNYDKDFINDAVSLYEKSDKTFVEISERLGIPTATLRYWYYDRVGREKKKPKNKRAGEVPAVVVKEETAAEKIKRLERELATARRQIETLEEDRAILKKAAAFFAKESE
jgi:transposase-like protein